MNFSSIRVKTNETTKYGVKLFKSNLNLAKYFYSTIYFAIQDPTPALKLVRSDNI